MGIKSATIEPPEIATKLSKAIKQPETIAQQSKTVKNVK